MLLIHINVFFLCTSVVFCNGRLCNRETKNGSIEQSCCYASEFRDGRCVECEIGFHIYDGGNCTPCPEPYYGYKCRQKCACRTTKSCHHVKGCLPDVLHITEAVTTDDHTEDTNILEYTYMYVLAVIAFGFLICSSTCFYFKCKKSCQGTDQTTTTHQNESGNNPPQGETHRYDEVDDEFLNRQSSVNDGHDVRSTGSSSGGSGICGIDSDGYLNPYHALNSIETTIGQGASSEQSSTETSYVQAQENSVYFQTSE